MTNGEKERRKDERTLSCIPVCFPKERNLWQRKCGTQKKKEKKIGEKEKMKLDLWF